MKSSLPDEYPKEDDTEGWDKYLFNSKRIWKNGKEFDMTHIAITASQSLVAMKKNKQRVWDSLKKDGTFVRVREFTNYSDKVAIGWFHGINIAMSGKDNLTKSIRQVLEERTSIVDTEIVLESTRITQYVPSTKTVVHTEAWMLSGNRAYIDDIEKCLNDYLAKDPHEISLGLRNSIFVPASRKKTEMPIKVMRIREHNCIISEMASIEINNVFHKDDIRYNGKISELFEHYPEGELEGLKVSFRELLDEQLQALMDDSEGHNNSDDTIEEEMDYHEGVYDIYYQRGSMHISCKQSFVNVVIKGMKSALIYLENNLDEDDLAEFCNIRKLGPWNWPKVGAVHTYSENGIRRTPIDISRPDNIDAVQLQDFLQEQGMDYKHDKFESFIKLANLNKPPKALYHRRARPPIRTETPISKEGSQEFWKKLGISTKTPSVQSLINQLHNKKQKQRQSKTNETHCNTNQNQGNKPPAQVTPTESQQSVGTSLTGQTDFTLKLKEQREELQQIIVDMAHTHKKELQATENKLKETESTINTLSQGFKAMSEQNKEMMGKLVTIKSVAKGHTEIQSFMKTILERMDTTPTSPTRKKRTPNRRTRTNNSDDDVDQDMVDENNTDHLSRTQIDDEEDDPGC